MKTLDPLERDSAFGAAPDKPPNAAPTNNQPAPNHTPPPSARQRHTANRWHIEPVLEAQEESWLMTYLDVITLLLVMMVVMLSLAGPPNGETTTEAESPQPDTVAAAPAATQVSPDIVPLVPLPVALPAATDPLAGLPLEQLGKDIEVVKSDTGVRFRISSEILFSSGAASLAQGGLSVLDTLLPVLNAQPELRLVVEGHTDNVPIQTERFPSNWELSTGRAASVARYLIERGIAPQRLQATGYADTRPISEAQSPLEKALNRRVELTMEKPVN